MAEITVDDSVLAQILAKCNPPHTPLLEGCEHIRKRPAMYIGDTKSFGLYQLFFEVLNNAMDEVLACRATDIQVILHKDGSISIQDNGGGIPEQPSVEEGIPGIEKAMTVFNVGGTYKSNSYRVSGGLHGVGLVCVNALSAWCEARVERGGQIYTLRSEQGIPTSPLEKTGKTTEHGTTITWLPDREIFGEYKYTSDFIKSYLRKICYLTPEATIHFRDDLNLGISETYQCPQGVVELIKSLEEYQECLGGIVHSREVRDGVVIDFALQFTMLPATTVFTFANNVYTGNGGTHFKGFQSGLRRAISSYAGQLGDVDGDHRYFTYGDASQGVVAAVSIRHLHPRFEGSTRSILGNEEVEGIVDVVVREAMGKFFAECPEVGRQIVERAADEQRKRRQKNGAKQQRNMTRRV